MLFIKHYCIILVCLPFDRKVHLGCQKHNSKRFTSLSQNCLIRYSLNPKRGEFVQHESGTEKEPRSWLKGPSNISVWFVPTGMNGLWLVLPTSNLTIYLPFRIYKIFCQMVSTTGRIKNFPEGWMTTLWVSRTY